MVEGIQAQVMKQREGMRHRLLKKSLLSHADREAHPVTVFTKIADDKFAGSWLLDTPSPDSDQVCQGIQEVFLLTPRPPFPSSKGWGVGREACTK